MRLINRTISLLLLLTGVQTTTLAQSIVCSDFTIDSLFRDPQDTQILQVRLRFQNTPQTFINYPHITALMDCNGDTFAKGTMNFFGQFGGTQQNYPLNLIKETFCEPFTAVFVYSTNIEPDTCLLGISAPLWTSPKTKVCFRLYPNPSTGQIYIDGIQTADNLSFIKLYDARGRLLRNVLLGERLHEFDISELHKGFYYIQINGHTERLHLE